MKESPIGKLKEGPNSKRTKERRGTKGTKERRGRKGKKERKGRRRNTTGKRRKEDSTNLLQPSRISKITTFKSLWKCQKDEVPN